MPKVLQYYIKEIIPENTDGTYTLNSIIYDGSVYTLDVTVSDDEPDGTLEIDDVLKKDGTPVTEMSFENTFVPDAVPYVVEATKTYEKGLVGNDFEFKLVSSDNKTNVDQTKHNDADGNITFDAIEFTAAGEYKFKLTEKTDGIFSFILPSQAIYEITVTVVNENGVLRVSDVQNVNTKNTGETELKFVNTYVLDGEDGVIVRGVKEVVGGRTQVNANEFEFGLYDAEGTLVEYVKNDADGNFVFSELIFDETDIPISGQKEIVYTVKEIPGNDIRMTYDQTVYDVVVTVKDNEQGGVTASYTVDNVANGEIKFTNTYTPRPEDITVDFNIVKTVVNKRDKKIGPEGFKFLLDYQAEGVADATVVSDKDGKAKFTLNFTEDDIGNTYTYKLSEVNDSKPYVTYSKLVYTVTVKISLNDNNELVADLTQNGESATQIVTAFENTYDYTDAPKTGDNSRLSMWFALFFVCGGALTILAVFDRKRKTATK